MNKRIGILMAALLSALVLVAVTVSVTVVVRGNDQEPAAGGGGDMMGRWMAQSVPDSESDYLTEMVAHHEEAVTAATELARSDRAQMRKLGASIVKSQTAQIEQMNGWLSRWYPDAGPTLYQPMMRDLSKLDGDQLDRAFLDDIIGHHMMAVMMSQHFLVSGLANHSEVTTLAKEVRDEQHAEIATMMGWYRDWFGTSWRGGPMGMNGPMGMMS